MKTLSTYQQEFATYSGNATTVSNTTNSLDNLSWGLRMINDNIKLLSTIFYFNEASYAIPGGSIANTNNYPLPSDFEQFINMTVQIGGLLWQPRQTLGKEQFDALNVIPSYNDYVQYWLIFANKLLIYPTPATSSNVITINYKKRVSDISMADVTQTTSSTTITATNSSTTITAAGGTPFTKWMGYSGWLQIPFSSTDASSGDNRWYQIDSVTSSTVLVLKNPYQGATVTGASFTIGDVPVLPEDYQPLPLYYALRMYYTVRVPDTARAAEFKNLYEEGYVLLDAKYGSKSNSPVLPSAEAVVFNPNLFPVNLH
jgi:hypothetical protein